MSSSLPRALHETPLALKRRARRMARELRAEYPDAHCELDHGNAFELLVATVLSAQTTDVRVNSVTPALFARCPTPAALAATPVSEIEELIRPTGFFRAKAHNIQALAARLCEHYQGEVPGRLKDLVTLPGVGRKTANVVLGNAFGIPGLTVDTHFGRLVRRFGWTAETDPVKVEQIVGDLIPRRDWTILSHVLIFHGRQVCHSRKPACGACVVATSCPSFGLGEIDPEAALALVRPPAGPHRSMHHGVGS